MKKDLLKMAVIGLAAGVCLSMQVAPSKSVKVIAMSKCSKGGGDDHGGSCSSCNGNGKGNGSCSSNKKGKDDSSCSGASGCNSTDASSKVKHRKSAARKVLEGY